MLIIEDERDAQANQVKMYATKIEFLTNELNNLKNSLEQKTVEIKELHKQSLEHENLNADLKKTLGKINQKSIIFQKEIDHEKFLRNQAERRLFEFESKLEEMSHHVYDSRKLEQSVLALLAFFHSPNQTTTVVSKKKLF
uniref:Uncharacterized protein n=1 Tax=Acrobeloides nanus TaxID=290746 RepID=A0A914DY20_9BILA